MRVAIRTDSSSRIGGGHVGRCLALAQALDARGHDVRFLCRDLPGSLSSQIVAAGFPVAELDGALAIDGGGDALATLAAMADFDPDWVVVDCYGLDQAWESAVRAGGRRLLVIDDLADRSHDCDVLVDVNRLDGNAYAGLVPAGARVLAGPRFALLRREFARSRRTTDEQPGDVSPDAALVFFGAADGAGMTECCLDALDRLPGRDFTAHVVVGPANPRGQAIGARLGTMARVVRYDGVADMAALFARMDFAIGGGGTTLWERCCLGLPTLAVCLADNQSVQLATAEALGAVRVAGAAAGMTADRLAAAIRDFVDDAEGRAGLRRAGRTMVDGLGSARVAALMDPMQLARATAADERVLWEWANDPDVRANSFSPEPIPYDTHRAWFSRRLTDPDSCIFIARRDGVPIGQVRFDRDGDHAVIDISIEAAGRGRGLGAVLLMRAVELFHAECPTLALVAEVKCGNHASRAMFRAAGFRAAVPLRAEAERLILEFP